MPPDTATETAAEYYDTWYRESAWASEEPTPTAPWQLLARKHLGDVSGARTLEIGCGQGAFCKYLIEQGADVVGADFSPAAVEQAKHVVGESDRFEPVVADIQAIPYPDESFDLVVSLMTLEHTVDPMQGLAELVRVTRRGGRLVLSTPNYLSLVGLRRFVVTTFLRRTWRECDQPINHPLMLFRFVRAVRRQGCRIDLVDGEYHALWLPAFLPSFELTWLEHPICRRLTRWFGLHTLTIATRR